MKNKKKNVELENIITDLKNNIPELFTGFSIMIILILLLILRRQYITAIIGMIAISIIGLEKRGKHFDRIVATFVILFLTISFLFL